MTGQRDFQPAAQRGAVKSRDHRLGTVFDAGQHTVQVGRCQWLAEFADVGTGNEGAATTDDDQGLDGGVGDALVDAVLDTLAHGLGQGVDRRVVDGDDADVADDGEINEIVHLQSLDSKIVLSAWVGGGGVQETSSHSLRTLSLARNSSGVPSKTMRPCPMT